MNVSMNWLKDYIKSPIDPDQLAETLSLHAQEVADVRPLYAASNLVLGTVLSTADIPGSKNKKCTVEVAGKKRTIVCGAVNVKAHQTVIVADIGATLPGGITIQKARINDIESAGMIVSLNELGLDKKYQQETGIHVVKGPAKSVEDAGYLDTVVALDLTPNRMDLMSVMGVAYEVAALYEIPLEIPSVTVNESPEKNPYRIALDTSMCDAYYGRVIKDVTVQESPDWLKNRLIAAGIRPINSIVDVTNYVMIDLGQPLHAFDSDQIKTDQIVVKEAKKGETFKTLDGQIRALNAGDVLITDGLTPLALGGVMGGFDSEVTSATTTVFLESALFNGIRIGQTSRRLDLRSESSLRFERGTAHDRAVLALDKAAQMIAELASGTVLKGICKAENALNTETTIHLSAQRVNGLLGTDLSVDAIQTILLRLGLPSVKSNDDLTVTIPVRRLDLVTDQDLIEEVGRVYGYNHLDATLPSTRTDGRLTAYQIKRRAIKSHLEGLGLSEVITYSLTHPSKEEGFGIDRPPLHVLKPLSESNISLKRTVVPGLLDVCSHHAARQMEAVHIYELRNLYLANEVETLGIALMGPLHPTRWQKSDPVSFYTLKGIVAHVFALLGLRPSFETLNIPAMHPHQTASIKVLGESLGFLGVVHPTTLKAYDLTHAVVAEINLQRAVELAQLTPAYHPVSKMPSVKRDLALIVDQTVEASALIKTIQAAQIPHLIDLDVFDVYTGSPLADTEKSLALRLWFNDPKETFKTETIEAYMQTIIQALQTAHTITLRD